MGDTAQRLVTEPLTVVGDADGALARALSSRGAAASSVGIHELTRVEPGWLVLLGKAAVDGGQLAISRAPEGSRLVVVLPPGAAAERLTALTLGARVVEPHPDPIEQAASILDSLERGPSTELGWTDVASLLDAARDRLVSSLGASGVRGLQLELGSAQAVAAALDRFADEIGELAKQTRTPDALGPSVAVAELSWDDDPQTLQQKSAEVARWRRLSARGVSSKMIRGLEKGSRDDSGRWARGGEPSSDPGARPSEIVTRGGSGRAPLPNPGRLPSGVMPEPQSEDMTLPGENPMPLVRRHDPDIDETAPRPAVDDDEDDDVDYALPRVLGGVASDSGSFHEDETKPAAYAMPLPPVLDPEAGGEPDELARPSAPPPQVEGASTPQRATPSLPPLAPLPPPESVTPSAPPRSGPQSYSALEVPERKSKLPLIFGLGVVVLGALGAIATAGGFALGAFDSGADPAVARIEPGPAPREAPEPEGARVVTADEARGGAVEVAMGSETNAREAAPAADDAPEGADDAPAGAEDEVADAQSPRERSDVLVERGHGAEREGDLEGAREAYLGAIEIYEINPHAHAGLARLWLEANDAEAALPFAERAVALRRRRAAYYSLLGDVQRARGQSGAARAAYEQALELDPSDPRARRALGM